MPGAHETRNLNGNSFIYQELAKSCTFSGLPVRVEPVVLLDDCLHLAFASWRGVADPVRNLVREPERNKVGIESEATSFRIGNTREMFETDKRNCSSTHDKLACIRGADTTHEH